MKIIDFYTGFEGEPEMKITEQNEKKENVVLLKSWIGYFDEIMLQIPPVEGKWEGIVLHYHLETGWYDGPWKCDDVTLLIQQLSQIDQQNMTKTTSSFLETFLELCKESQQNENVLLFEYD